jgi:FkbM family methyltransferase
MNFIQRLTYHPAVTQAARTLRLRRILRSLYYRWAGPADGILRIGVGGIEAEFSLLTREPAELRGMESEVLKERHILELLISALRPGDTVYDVGASVGLYTVLLAKAVGNQGQVIALEPEKQSYARLLGNVELNALTNVRCIRKALGAEPGEGKLSVIEGVTAPSLLPPPENGRGGQGTGETVEVDTGDRLVTEEKLPLPRIVKVDVEGYEYPVIQGLRQTLAQPECQLVCCEIHPNLMLPGARPEDLMAALKSLGFSAIDSYPCHGRVEYHVVCRKVIASAGREI